MSKPIFHLHGTGITGPMYGRIISMCRGSRRDAALACFRCAMAVDVKNPMRWITDGLYGEKRYAARPCKYEEKGPAMADAWIREHIEGGKKTSVRAMVQMKDALVSMLAGLQSELAAMPAEPEPVKRKGREPLEQLELFK